MKLYKKLLILPAVAALAAATFAGCSEETTLSGAKAVYIELTPSSNINLHIGDTTRVTARVTNVNGDVINTPIKWAIDDSASAIELVEDSVANSTLITCGDGAQGKSTKLRAILENDAYAVTTVSVVKAVPAGVNAIMEDGTLMPEKRSWDMQHDSIIFAVEPKQLLLDFEPTYNFDGMEPYGDNGGVAIDRKHGLVTLHFSTPRETGEHNVSVTVGSGAAAKTGVCNLKVMPPIEGATFYGPKYAGMPYIDGRPPQGTLEMYYAYTYEETMDINDVDTVRVAFNVQTGDKHDIEQSYSAYRWEAVEGSSVMKVADKQEFVAGNGFDAVLVVRSGLATGTTVFHCITPDTILVATFDVHDFAEEYPVNAITCDHTSVETLAGVSNAVTIEMGTDPMSSFGIHKPKPTVEDPTVATISDYDGRKLTITGLKPGTTNIRFTSNKAPEFVLPVTINEAYNSIAYDRTDLQYIFAGQSAEWNTTVVTASGLPNTLQVQFTSANTSVATVANLAGSLDKATVTGVRSGRTSITASIGGRTVSRNINVVAIPDDTNYEDIEGIDDPFSEGYGMGGDGSNLYIDLLDGGVVTFNNAFNGSLNNGTYNVSAYDVVYSFDGAEANVVAGSMTVANGSEEGLKRVTFTFTIRFSDGVERTLTATNIEVAEW